MPARPTLPALGRGLPSDPASRRATTQLETATTDLQQRMAAVEQAGGVLNRQIFTTGGTWVPTPGTTRAKFKVQAAGGGGGGTTGGGAGAAAAGGGAYGILLEFWIMGTVPLTGGTVAVGAAGTGGTPGNPGGTGGDASVTVNGVVYTAKGGLGGAGHANGAATVMAAGGGIQAGSSPADKTTAAPGQYGLFLAGSFAVSGAGGSGPLGGGGVPVGTAAPGPGSTGPGVGGGGSGACSTTGNNTGGAGGPAWVEIEEYV